MRILITGSPKAGKSTLAGVFERIFQLPLRRTDEVKDLEWSDASAEVCKWFDAPDPWIIEGVTIPRALRKWRNFKGPEAPPPFDWFVFMPHPRQFLGTGQETMRKQVEGMAIVQKDWIGERWIEL